MWRRARRLLRAQKMPGSSAVLLFAAVRTCFFAGGGSDDRGLAFSAPRFSPGAQLKSYFNESLTIMEGENFSDVTTTASSSSPPPCRGAPWSSCAWADDGNLFASDVSNVFMSRRAYLHADANATFGAQATAVVPVAASGSFNVMARYEAGYRFHSPFKIEVQQAGAKLFSKVFGLKSTPKVWGFQHMRAKDSSQGCGPGLQPECRWIYSATENMVWEGTTPAYRLNLTKGVATITLTIVGVDGNGVGGVLAPWSDRWGAESAAGELITERNVDAILLHPNQTDIDFRMNTTYMPNCDGNGLVFDSLVSSQDGEVFARVTSKSYLPMAFGFPRTFNRSPLWEERTYFPQWKNSSTNINIPHHKTFPVPRAGQRVDKAGWIWSIGDAGACTKDAHETGVVVYGQNATDVPDPALVWPGQPECIVAPVAPHATTDWIDIGRLVDTLDHSYFNLPGMGSGCGTAHSVPCTANYTIEFGLMGDDGKVEPIPKSVYDGQPNPKACEGEHNIGNRSYSDEKCWLAPSFTTVLMDASVRASRRTRPITAEFTGIMEQLDSRPTPHGKPPTEVMITADTFSGDWAQTMYSEGQGYPDPTWQAGVKKFHKMFAISTGPPTFNSSTNFGEVSGWLGKSVSADQGLQGLVTNGAGNKSWFTNLGDEISLTGPQNDQRYKGTDPSSGSGFPLYVNQSALNTIWEQWLKHKKIAPKIAGCDPYAGCVFNTSISMPSEGKARSFYYSNLFRYDWELHNSSLTHGALANVPYHNVTAQLLAFQKKTGQLLNGQTTANFPPSTTCFDERYNQTRDNSYLPKTNMWIQGFRQKTFTLPFTEDYIFQIAAGTQQMFDLVIDVERAAIRQLPSADELAAMPSPIDVAAAPLRKLPSSATVPGRPIMQYIMVHSPGNTVRSQRRRFYSSIAHGAKWINYFVLKTFATGPGDFCDSHHMYPAVQKQLNEYGMFDDIVAHGVPQAQGAKAAIVFSATEDMYWDTFGTPGAAKRALFVTIRHAQIALDVICEDDIESGLADAYALIFLSAGHLRAAAATALTRWVAEGGTLFASVGMGMLNEFNESNTDLAALYAIEAAPFAILGSHQAGPGSGEISFVKQDLQYAEPLDTVTVAAATAATANSPDGGSPLLALGEKAVLQFAAKPSAADTFARFKDHSPALYRQPHGKGAAVVAAFHLGLSYFRPALPKRPVSRGSTDETFNHFVPTAFGVAARSLIEASTSHIAALQPVIATPERRLDIMVIAAAGRGTVITVVNWSDSLVIKGLELVLQFDCTFGKATLASGGAVRVSKAADGKTKLTLDLGVADAVILRV